MEIFPIILAHINFRIQLPNVLFNQGKIRKYFQESLLIQYPRREYPRVQIEDGLALDHIRLISMVVRGINKKLVTLF